MGYPYSAFIPAAILLDNPGITKEKFAKLLFQTNSTENGVSKYTRWDLSNMRERKSEYNDYHRGIQSVAYFFGILKSENFGEQYHSKLRKDRNGLEYGGQRLEVYSERLKGKWKNSFVVVTQKPSVTSRKLCEDIFQTNEDHLEETEVGSIFKEGEVVDRDFFDHSIGADYIRVEEYLGGYRDSETPWRKNHLMRVRKINLAFEKEKFSNLEDVIEKHNHFDPNFMYDFSPSEGNLEGGMLIRSAFRWKKIDDKYYLDEDYSFGHLPSGILDGGGYFGYTDLIVTAEAIKNKAWKILSYKGLNHASSCFKRFPKVRKRYEQAVWDSHTSLAAKKKKMTNNQLLRWRLTGLRDSTSIHQED
ncbi:hypothetical protein KW787_01565 [Candidatus Pacearchaeota archaeon]|nr:hypothetical protein [Candidatus Pacearchaeota archaeon]